ncbi:peptide deformylase [Candidatus Peregrinibacteria bacterium]|nr:peptide deformylase [Candidatus Peregrinibacteria bacterium]
MPVLPILTGSSTPMLRMKTKRVPKISKDIQKLIRDMELTVKAADGLGLAAPQVNQSVRICLARLHGKMTPLINPDILWKSPEKDISEEGCLSLPDLYVNVPRSLSIVLKYQNAKGEEQERRLTDMEARIVQHEVDHLDGVLIVDYK